MLSQQRTSTLIRNRKIRLENSRLYGPPIYILKTGQNMRKCPFASQKMFINFLHHQKEKHLFHQWHRHRKCIVASQQALFLKCGLQNLTDIKQELWDKSTKGKIEPNTIYIEWWCVRPPNSLDGDFLRIQKTIHKFREKKQVWPPWVTVAYHQRWFL